MLTNIYVIDYVLKDLDGAKERLDRIFGTEPLWIHPDMTPGQEIRATYYQIPGTDEMSHALGMFQEGGDSIRVAHDRLFLIGVMCDDIETTMTEISARGLQWVHKEPHRYAVGESNTLGTLHGVEVFVARHIPGGDKVARQMMFTKDGSSDFGDDTQEGQFLGFHGLDFAVHNLDAAITTYSKVFGSAPTDTSARTAAEGVRSAHFAAPGNERGQSKGIHEIGFFEPQAPQASPLARQLSAWLERHGEGIFRMDLRVKNVAAMRAILKSRGINLPEGDAPSLSDIHGTDLRYVAV